MDEVCPSNEPKVSAGGGGGAEDLSSSSAAPAGAGFNWRPRLLVFGPYEIVNNSQALRVVVRKPVSVLAFCFCCKSF
jgi:hypothetical protein